MRPHQACDACRRKKLRCDGQRPICTRCQRLGNSCRYADVDKPNRGSTQRSLAALRETRVEEAGPSDACTTDVQTVPVGTAEQAVVERDNGPRSQQSSPSPASQSPGAASAHGSPSGTSTGIVVGDSKDMRFFGKYESWSLRQKIP
jgi:hypothetical protein